MRKNILRGTRVYLAGNLENTSDPFGWRHMVEKRLSDRGITILSPTKQMFVGQRAENEEFFKEMSAYRDNPHKVHEVMLGIVGQDLRMIDIADFVIVNLEVKKPTFGTMHEVVIASQQKKPTFLNLQDKSNVPRWLAGLFKPSYLYETLEEILEKVEQIDEGLIEIDTTKWRLLLPQYRAQYAEVKTAQQWNDELDYGIVDYDGFRERGFYINQTLITQDEFYRRAISSTRKFIKL